MSDARSVRTLFDELMGLSLAERAARLEAATASPEVIARVRALLLADDRFPAPVADGGGDVTIRAHPWPGDRVEGWRLVAPIGVGGMSTIWRATSESAPEVRVAIKFPAATGVTREESRARLRQERAILAALDHPAIVGLIDAGETAAGEPYLVLAELSGSALDEHVRRCQPGGPALCRLLARVAEAVAAAHALGIVHRDLKPSNVLVTDDGWPTLIDFGIARITDDSPLTRHNLTVGHAPSTPAWASPEQARGEIATAASDVYGLGRIADAALEASTLEAGPIRARLKSIAAAAQADRPGDRPEHAVTLARAFTAAAQAGGAPLGRRHVTLITSLAGLAGLAIGLAIRAPLWFGGQDQVRVPAEVADGLLELPLDLMPGSPDALARLGEHMGEPIFLVAAARAHVSAGDLTDALDALDHPDLNDDLDALAPGVRLVLAEGWRDVGRPGRARALVAGVNPELLDADERLRREFLLTRVALDTQRPVDARAIRAVLDEQFEVDDPDLHLEAIRLGIALALPEALRAWVEDGDPAPADDPLELAAVDLLAMLELHRRLADQGLADPIDDDVLQDLEATADEQLDSSSTFAARRALAAVRVLRARQRLVDDARSARDLALAGLTDAEDLGMPDDARLALAVVAWAAAPGDADRARVLELAARVEGLEHDWAKRLDPANPRRVLRPAEVEDGAARDDLTRIARELTVDEEAPGRWVLGGSDIEDDEGDD